MYSYTHHEETKFPKNGYNIGYSSLQQRAS